MRFVEQTQGGAHERMGFWFNSRSGSEHVDWIRSRVVAVLWQPCRTERRARRASSCRWRDRGQSCASSAGGALEGGAKWTRRWSRWPHSRGCVGLNGWRTRKGRRRAVDGVVSRDAFGDREPSHQKQRRLAAVRTGESRLGLLRIGRRAHGLRRFWRSEQELQSTQRLAMLGVEQSEAADVQMSG